jgi:hypothetical protein
MVHGSEFPPALEELGLAPGRERPWNKCYGNLLLKILHAVSQQKSRLQFSRNPVLAQAFPFVHGMLLRDALLVFLIPHTGHGASTAPCAPLPTY